MTPRERELISAMVDGELTGDEHVAVEALLDSSAEARELRDQYTKLRQATHNLPHAEVPADFSIIFGRALDAEVALNKDGKIIPMRRIVAWTGGIAAMVVLGISISVFGSSLFDASSSGGTAEMANADVASGERHAADEDMAESSASVMSSPANEMDREAYRLKTDTPSESVYEDLKLRNRRNGFQSHDSIPEAATLGTRTIQVDDDEASADASMITLDASEPWLEWTTRRVAPAEFATLETAFQPAVANVLSFGVNPSEASNLYLMLNRQLCNAPELRNATVVNDYGAFVNGGLSSNTFVKAAEAVVEASDAEDAREVSKSGWGRGAGSSGGDEKTRDSAASEETELLDAEAPSDSRQQSQVIAIDLKYSQLGALQRQLVNFNSAYVGSDVTLNVIPYESHFQDNALTQGSNSVRNDTLVATLEEAVKHYQRQIARKVTAQTASVTPGPARHEADDVVKRADDGKVQRSGSTSPNTGSEPESKEGSAGAGVARTYEEQIEAIRHEATARQQIEEQRRTQAAIVRLLKAMESAEAVIAEERQNLEKAPEQPADTSSGADGAKSEAERPGTNTKDTDDRSAMEKDASAISKAELARIRSSDSDKQNADQSIRVIIVLQPHPKSVDTPSSEHTTPSSDSKAKSAD